MQSQLAMSSRCHAVEAAFFNEIQLARGHPVALIVANGDDVVWADSHAIGRAKTGGHDLQARTIFGNLDQTALMRRSDVRLPRRAFGEIKITL